MGGEGIHRTQPARVRAVLRAVTSTQTCCLVYDQSVSVRSQCLVSGFELVCGKLADWGINR